MIRAFKVILIGVSRNPERIVVIMYNNVDIISETYKDIASGKQQICRFQQPHSGFKTAMSNAFECLEIIYIARVIDLHFCRWQHRPIFVTFHAIIFESQTL